MLLIFLYVFFKKKENKYFLKKKRKIHKMFFVFEIIVSELLALNCVYSGNNASHRVSMSQQKTLGCCVSLKVTFSNATTFTVINKYRKGAAIQIGTVFRPICLVLSLWVL